ncbi:MAG: D-aminoacyl-tRNA deacylase [Sphaerochaetaceae bacterium]|jgi:D-tyrosyl-tRNA(Tyr) deacylase|nr:D-aminoacyl-tRNA deacylase [Sphaerochaetaceae bacterium]
MRAVLQRVVDATIVVNNELVASIPQGLLVYLGVERDDGEKELNYMVRKVAQMRLFSDEDGKMNLSVSQLGQSVMVVSQFTLCADLNKGNRPSFNPAAEPDVARSLYEQFIEKLRELNLAVVSGIFGASMQVSYTNEGPVTIILDSRENLK